MSNAYNITVPDGPQYPSQQFVDDFLNGIDNLPSCQDLQKLIDMGEEAAKEYIQGVLDAAQSNIESFFSSITDSLQRKMEPLEALIEPPSSLDDVLQYCQNIADYFATPYNQMVELVTFYAEFSAAATQAIQNKLSDMACLNVSALKNSGDKS